MVIDKVFGLKLVEDLVELPWLCPEHARFYSVEGLVGLRDGIAEGGVFAMWSDEGPDEAFIAVLKAVFMNVRAEVVAFDNPLTGGASTCSRISASRTSTKSCCPASMAR